MVYPCALKNLHGDLVELAKLVREKNQCPWVHHEWGPHNRNWTTCSHHHSNCKDLNRSNTNCKEGSEDGWIATLCVKDYKSSDLSIKANDDSITVEGKHEEREDECGFISRQFVRRYTIPKEYDVEKASSTLSCDGVLTIKVPSLGKSKVERFIQIHETGRTHEALQNEKLEEEEEEVELVINVPENNVEAEEGEVLSTTENNVEEEKESADK